ncbi:hypothetical protein BJV82DRAFT_653576 [Fennellomyces sp. T-0311]|nr:hypothetical protein BJV82DRAFT_653576 [Fennellomyces sp. T-0311]
MTPENQAVDLIKRSDNGEQFTISHVESIYNQLKAVESSQLIGEWKGGEIATGSSFGEQLKGIKWDGKKFISVNEVEPIIVLNDKGEREYLEEPGPARIRSVLFRGVVSSAMIYDNQPIIDHFRYIDNDTVVGYMDTKMQTDPSDDLYFYLKRIAKGRDSRL